VTLGVLYVVDSGSGTAGGSHLRRRRRAVAGRAAFRWRSEKVHRNWLEREWGPRL